MTAHPAPSSPEPSPSPTDDDTKPTPVSMTWVVIGSLVVLVGAAMGFVMSSLGK